MNALTRLLAWLRPSDRGQAARPGSDRQFSEWLNTARPVLDMLTPPPRRLTVEELDQQAAALGLSDVSTAASPALRLVDILRHAARWRREAEAQRELLGQIWLYVHWHYVTRQLTTAQKNLWADAVDTSGEPGPKAERWWTGG